MLFVVPQIKPSATGTRMTLLGIFWALVSVYLLYAMVDYLVTATRRPEVFVKRMDSEKMFTRAHTYSAVVGFAIFSYKGFHAFLCWVPESWPEARLTAAALLATCLLLLWFMPLEESVKRGIAGRPQT